MQMAKARSWGKRKHRHQKEGVSQLHDAIRDVVLKSVVTLGLSLVRDAVESLSDNEVLARHGVPTFNPGTRISVSPSVVYSVSSRMAKATQTIPVLKNQKPKIKN